MRTITRLFLSEGFTMCPQKTAQNHDWVLGKGREDDFNLLKCKTYDISRPIFHNFVL
jgi:hypothetical protein